MKAPEQVKKLEELTNIAYRIAKAVIEKDGVYYCIIDGKRTKVIK